MTRLGLTLIFAVLAFAGLYLAGQLGMAMRGAPPIPYRLDVLAQLPVSDGGRVKPLDTVARTSLMILSGKQDLKIDGEQQPAIRWLADVIAKPEKSDEYKIFRVDHPDVLTAAGLEQKDGPRFSFNQIRPKLPQIVEQARRAAQLRAGDRNAYQKNILTLHNHVQLYVSLAQLQTPYAVPPLKKGEEWRPLSDALVEAERTGVTPPAANAVGSIFMAYLKDQPDLFNREATAYKAMLDSQIPRDARKARFEVMFNAFAPFYHAAVLYVLASVLAFIALMLRCMSKPDWAKALGGSVVALLLFTWVLHTFGLVSRMWLQGRPPVTNLYSSAVFIGWGAVIVSILLERLTRLGVATIVGSVMGFCTLIIAHHLANSGDTMEMMQAVLDTNFWLATHVVAVTIGYSATFLAGTLAIVYILLGLVAPMLWRRGVTKTSVGPELFKTFAKMVYGVICFALLFSLVGTVLGGIWADQSWGRFWGWDPKENGAVLIVLMNALTLHARWGGMIRERGMMVLAVLGNIITSWSWFGTNMLGVGLHSYGFMESAMFWLILFVVSQLAIMMLGLMPVENWTQILKGEKAASAEGSFPVRLTASKPAKGHPAIAPDGTS